MIELLERVSTVDPDRPGVITDVRVYTYGELYERAKANAAGLVANGVQRFAAVAGDVAEVVAILAGASMAGSEACLYPPGTDLVGVRELAARLRHDSIVTDDPALVDLVERVGIAELASTGGAAPETLPGSRPLLVLTTGTTGPPRGVCHDWARLLRAAERVQAADRQRWLLAYGLHQFGGLQVLVHVLAAGATLVVPSGVRPRDGLAAIRRCSVSHVSATPTWWRFLLAAIEAGAEPAPPLEQVTLGGEAAPESLLRQLQDVFASARVSHVYAATEVGSTGSVRDGHSGMHISILQRGDDDDVAFRIVDGELWTRSRIGMLGYFDEDPVDPDEWRPTGDLVEIVGDRVEFRGRNSDVINVGGVKVHPLAIEELVEGVPGVQIARVFGRPNKMTGAIVAVEAVAAPGLDPRLVTQAIREACASLPAAAQPRSIRVVDELTTHGGKRTRRDIRVD